MEQMVNVFVMGKKYEVPASLTIIRLWNMPAINWFAAVAAEMVSAVPVQQFIVLRATVNCTPVWHARHRL